MPIGVKVKIKNLRSLKRNLDAFPSVSKNVIADGINKAVIAVEKETLPITPRDTGKLKAQFGLDRILANPSRLTGAVRNTTPYAAAVHSVRNVGERYRSGKNTRAVGGFLIVGRDKAESEIDRIFDEALEKIVDETRTIF